MRKDFRFLGIVLPNEPRNFKFLAAGFSFLALYLALFFLEVNFVFSRFDPSITETLQATLPRTVDIPFSFFSLFGSFEITTILVGLIALIIFRKEKVFLWSLAFFGFFHIFEIIGKRYLYHPTPPEEYFRYALPFQISTVRIESSYAFPSGHVGRTLFLAVLVAFLVHRYVKNVPLRNSILLCLTLLVIFMSVSRVYLGEHWATDVLGGVLLGTAMSLFTLVYLDKLPASSKG